MKIRLEFIIIYKLAMMALVEASEAKFARVKICQYKGKLQLLIHSPGVTLEKTNSAVFKYLAEMKSRANAIHASLQVLSENGGTEVRVIVRV
jgi:nitrate/nitrite-specific signal transduction histidine kinase